MTRANGGQECKVSISNESCSSLGIDIAGTVRRFAAGSRMSAWVWVYMLTREAPHRICYPTYEVIMRGAGIDTKSTVSKAIHRLEKIGLIKVHNDHGTRRYLPRAPRLAVERLFELNEISLDELEDANDLLERVGMPLIEPKLATKKPVVVPMPAKKTAQGND